MESHDSSSAPWPRGRDPAEALRHGARADLPIVADRLLGDPGVYVIDGRRAWVHWEERGHEGVMEYLMTGRDPLDGMARPPEAAHSLVGYMLGAAWPWFLEGVFFWQHADRLSVAYRDLRRRIDPWSPSWASRGRAG